MTDTAASTSLSSTVSRVLPVASTLVSEATGFAALQEDYSTTSSQPDRPTSADSTASNDTPSDETSALPAREDHTQELANGPSSSARPSTHQTAIGTESGIPTTAGAGTTVSPDDDVRAAISNERSHRGETSAAVGQDYSDQPCPTSDAKRDQPTSNPAEGKTRFESDEEQRHGSSTTNDASASTENGGEEEEGEGGKEQSKASFKDKLKGQAKVVAGKITRNEEKVESGRMLKSGAAGADA